MKSSKFRRTNDSFDQKWLWIQKCHQSKARHLSGDSVVYFNLDRIVKFDTFKDKGLDT